MTPATSWSWWSRARTTTLTPQGISLARPLPFTSRAIRRAQVLMLALNTPVVQTRTLEYAVTTPSLFVAATMEIDDVLCKKLQYA